MAIPQTDFSSVNDNFHKTHGYNGSSKLQHLARARNGIRYNCKSHLGNLKSDLRTLLGKEYKDEYEEMKEKIEDLQSELFDDVDDIWISKRKEVINDE